MGKCNQPRIFKTPIGRDLAVNPPCTKLFKAGLGTAFSHCFCVVVYLPVYRVSYRLVSWVRDQSSQLAGWAKKKLGWLRCARNVVQGVVDRVRVEDHETYVQSHVED